MTEVVVEPRVDNRLTWFRDEQGLMLGCALRWSGMQVFGEGQEGVKYWLYVEVEDGSGLTRLIGFGSFKVVHYGIIWEEGKIQKAGM